MAALETRLIIGATDETSSAFASVMARISELQAKIGAIDSRVATVNRMTPPPARPVSPTPGMPGESGGLWETGMAMVAAFTGTKMIMGGFHEAMAQQHERMRQEVASMSAEEIAKGETMAADLAAKYPAVPQSEIMHTLRTARTVTGSFEEGTAPLEALTKLRVVAQAAQTNASPEEMQEEFDKLVKALEIAGVATDPKRLNAYIGDIAKALNAFGDQLKPEDYFQMLKFGRGASPKISERFLMTTLATLGTEFGGANVGTALAGFSQAVIGNRFTHAAAKGFADIGLISDEDMLRTKTGEIMGIKPGRHVKDWQLAQTDPDLWIKQDYLPALARRGITDSDAISARIQQDFTNRNAANLVTQIALQQKKLEKNAELWQQAQGLSGADTLASKDATTVFRGMGNSINRAMSKFFDTDMLGEVGSAFNSVMGALTPAPSRRGDLTEDIAADKKGWMDFFSSLRVGGPQSSDDWHSQMRAGASLWGAGYRGGDLDAEAAREHARAAAASGQGSQSVSVSGQASVDQTLHIDISLDAGLRAALDTLTGANFSVPLGAATTGQMDTDAAPSRGIGRM